MIEYELLLETNRRILAGEVFSDKEKTYIVSQFLLIANTPKDHESYDEKPIAKARHPLFFSAPQNDGKKLKTIMGQLPKTHILNGNMYELEILRLLNLFAPSNPDVVEMTKRTLNRLKATCFGYHGCYLGECFDSSLVVLRFLSVAAPSEVTWMKKIIAIYDEHHADKRRARAVDNYYKLCLSELPFQLDKICAL